VGSGNSLEAFAATTDQVLVCKSMSQVYALSGARAAYLCGSPYQLDRLRRVTPPWVIGSLAQAAGLLALKDPDYYQARYRETAQLRQSLSEGLARLGWTVTPGAANSLLCALPPRGPDTRTLLQRCRLRGLFLRDARTLGKSLGDRSVRIAVKDGATNERMLRLVRDCMNG
jgi:histidinol-phosphate/aromatic aminotransferase/cobyric acid decarboxylase-like protein